MKHDLTEAIEKQYEGDTSPLSLQHKKFALTNRERGAQILEEVLDNTGLDVRGKKVLDVGCAYAGFVIEAAARGATAWGVEISKKLYDLAMLNAEGEPGEHTIVPGDFLASDVVDVLPEDFDLVLLNDVFEHIYDTATLLSNIDRVTAPGASIVFAIPNGDCVKFVEREGHYGIPGLSLLPPNWWHAVIPQFTAFYRPWRYYAALLRAFGFGDVAIWDPEPNLTLDGARQRIAEGLQRAEVAIDGLEYRDERARPMMQSAFAGYRDRVAEDLETGDVRLLAWRYLADFWRGVATKTESEQGRHELPGHWVKRRRQRIEPGEDVAYERVELSFSNWQMRTRWNTRSDSQVSVENGEIRCTIAAHEGQKRGHYGGIRLPVRAPLGARIELSFSNPENIRAVFVDGHNLWRTRVVRWQWRVSGRNEAPSTERDVFVLEPGKQSGPFGAVSPTMPQLARDLHVFLRVTPGTTAGFTVHGLELARSSSAASMRATSSG